MKKNLRRRYAKFWFANIEPDLKSQIMLDKTFDIYDDLINRPHMWSKKLSPLAMADLIVILNEEM
jgi:hypothetical protein